MRRPLASLVAFSAAAFLAAGGAAFGRASSRSADCDRVASPTGSDDAAGTSSHPFETALTLVQSLAPGQTGCLRDGSYDQFEQTVEIRTPRTTIRSYPGERAEIVGRIVIARTARGTTLSDLKLNGRNPATAPSGYGPATLPSPTVNAADVRFLGNEITSDDTGICLILGESTYGAAIDTLIEGNEIHNCGQRPPTNHEHGIYDSVSRGVRIIDNAIYANADRGIQLFPDAQGTRIEGNVLYGNGQGIIFSGQDGVASSNALVTGNVIVDSRLRYDVESYYPPGNPVGENNLVRDNCIGGGEYGGIAEPQVGFRAVGNWDASSLLGRVVCTVMALSTGPRT